MLNSIIYMVTLGICWSSITFSAHINERQKWTPAEDKILRNGVKEFNCEWKVIAVKFFNRVPKQCRERWVNHLDPTLKKGPLTIEEQKIILNLYKKHYNQWTVIAKRLRRSPNQIKNFWHAWKRKTAKSNDTLKNGEKRPQANADEDETNHRKKTKFDTLVLHVEEIYETECQ